MSDDQDVTVKLPLGAWRRAVAIIEAAPYREVAPFLEAMYVQINSQIVIAGIKPAEAAAPSAPAASVDAEARIYVDGESPEDPMPSPTHEIVH